VAPGPTEPSDLLSILVLFLLVGPGVISVVPGVSVVGWSGVMCVVPGVI
jgi:hypothetical protein